jgi:hypothetical protein
LFTKFAGGKLLVRTHQGLILLHKIAGGKLLVRTHQGLILLNKNCWWKTPCKNSPRMDSSSQKCSGKQHGRTHEVYSLAKVFWWKTNL